VLNLFKHAVFFLRGFNMLCV